MRGLVGFGLVGALIAGGIWGKNAVFGSDGAVCNEIHHMYAALEMAVATGDRDLLDTYDQNVLDFEFGQVKDAVLKRKVEVMFEETSTPDEAMAAFIAANDRCNAIGK